jgi:hypothetical protein
MAGQGERNTTKSPSVKEYQLAGGKIWIAELEDDGQPKAFRAVGNAPEITITVNTESYEHDSVQEGAPAQDMSTIISSAASMGFGLENWSAENMALFFSGDASAYTNPGVLGFDDVSQVLPGSVEAYGTYQIKDASGNLVFGITATNALDLKSTNGTPATLTIVTDYTIDANAGTFTLTDSAEVQTMVSGNEGIRGTVTADGTATDVDLVTVLSNVEKDVALRFELINANNSNKKSYYDVHKLSLAANGDASLISAEAGAMPMTGQVEVNDFYPNRIDIRTPLTQV